MENQDPIWLNLAPPRNRGQKTLVMWPIFRFIFRLARAVFPCGPRDRKLLRCVEAAGDSSTVGLLHQQCDPATPGHSASAFRVEVVDVERNSQAGVVGGKIMEDTVSREEFNAMKHQLEGVIKDLEEEMMMLQARIAVYLP